MSNLKQFTSKIENISSGEIVSALPADETFFVGQGFLKCDGSVLLQNAYPYLFENIGSISDKLTVPGSLITSGTSNNINALVYANNTFIYAGAGGVLATSNNAVTWTSRTSGSSNNINALTYGSKSPSGNTFVFVSDVNVSASTDGVTWQRNTGGQDPVRIGYVGGKTFARAGNTSTETVSLTDLTGGLAASPAANDLVFIAVATGSTALRSQAVTGILLLPAFYTQIASLYSNGTIDTNLWVGFKTMGSTPDTEVTIPSTGSLDDAQTVAIQVFRDATFYISNTVTATSNVRADAPAITTTSDSSVILAIGAGGHSAGVATYSSPIDGFLTVGSDDTYDSTIGFGFSRQQTAGAYNEAAFTFSAGLSSSYSSAAVTIGLKPKLNIKTITYANNTYVCAGTEGLLATATDAEASWASQTSGTSNTINTLTYGNNTFVYAGTGGVLATSANAVTWTQRTSGTSNSINALVYANNTFVYVGNGGVLATSPDAITWTQKTSGTSNNINTITYVNGLFIYSGAGGVLGTSYNTNTWTTRTSGTANNINSVIKNNNSLLFAGNTGTLGNYELYTYDYDTEFLLPTSNSYFDLYIKS
jgi:hypothetical protein